MAYPNDVFNNQSQDTGIPEQKINATTVNIARVFLYMFIGLMITTAVAFSVGAAVFYNLTEENFVTYLYVLIGSLVALVIDSLIIQFVFMKGKHSILIPGIIYCLLMGLTLSFLTLFIDWTLLGTALGITALAFLIMSLISFLTKGTMNAIVVGIMGLSIGVGLLFLVLWIYTLATGTVLETLYWIIIIGAFVLVMFITIYDLWRVKKIAEQGAMNTNIALYCAFTIYTDFINVFLRILYFVIIIANKLRR